MASLLLLYERILFSSIFTWLHVYLGCWSHNYILVCCMSTYLCCILTWISRMPTYLYNYLACWEQKLASIKYYMYILICAKYWNILRKNTFSILKQLHWFESLDILCAKKILGALYTPHYRKVTFISMAGYS